MAASSYTQSSFLGGEWSPLAQGKIQSKEYPTGMNVCRNGYPTEEGAWIRRSGTRLGGPTFGGVAGRVITFDFEEVTPYYLEFTDGLLRAWASAPQSSGLLTALPNDFTLVNTNDNQQVSSISTANPAVVQTGSAHGWATNDQVAFLFDQSVNAAFTPLLRSRLFKITVVDTTHFSLADAMTGTAIDGSTLGWSTPTASTVVVTRVLAISTPYTSSKWATVRKVQAETQAVFLQNSLAPRQLKVSSEPSATAFAEFTLTQPSFLDGPYLDPPTDGTSITPTTVSTSGMLPINGAWTAMASNGTIFVALNQGTANAAKSADGLAWTATVMPSNSAWSGCAWNGSVFAAVSLLTTAAASSADGITWVARTLPSASIWQAVASDGSKFVAISSGVTGSTVAATSPDGITWTARVMPTSALWSDIAWNGSVFCAVAYNSSIAATSPDGVTWTQRVLPNSDKWTSIAWNGSVFCAVANSSTSAATSADGITWVARTLPSAASWQDIAAGGSTFCLISSDGKSATSTDGIVWTERPIPTGMSSVAWNGTVFAVVGASSISVASATGVFSSTSLVFSSIASVNDGSGFTSTDVGRQIRLHSEPQQWFAATTYAAKDAVKFSGTYYVALASTTGDQPDISPTKWGLSTAVATWTWGTILSVTSPSSVTVSLQGPNLLYLISIVEWRLGAYSDTTGYPSCGVYYQGRLYLSGAIANRIDASQPNDLFNMAPTEDDGTVTDANAISYTFNSDSVNPIFWMVGQAAGILAGTQAGEWLIVAPTTGPITPTNIHAFQMTHYGSANMEPEATQLTVTFVQRFNRTMLECFPDALSGKYTAPNLTENGKHLTVTGIDEIRYQQELLPIIWSRMGDGSLAGDTYERDSLFSSQPAKYTGWHRHDFGNGDTVESIAVGPNEDGTVDTLAMVHNGDDDVRHVEFMQTIFKIGDTIQEGWFVDQGIVPSGGVISGKTLTLYGLWNLNGKTCAVVVGGVDMGDFVIASGSVVVPIDDDPDNLLTTSYLQTISASTYGAKATLIDGPGGRLVVPASVGFSFTSQGQTLRPDTVEQSRSQLGPAPGKPRRVHQFSALLKDTQGISFGTDFSKLKAAQFRTKGGTDYTALQLFSGVYWGTLDDDSSMDGMMCWEISRPYPACIPSLTGYMHTEER